MYGFYYHGAMPSQYHSTTNTVLFFVREFLHHFGIYRIHCTRFTVLENPGKIREIENFLKSYFEK